MRFHLAASAAVALLIVTVPTAGRAEKKRSRESKDSAPEVSAGVNKQFEWENKVVGPKEGIDKSHLAEVQERGRREDAERKKEPPRKVGRAVGVNAPDSVAPPTMDIEKPAAPPARKAKKVATAEPRHKDSLDNLLDSEGVKPFNGSEGGSGNDGLGSVLASDDKPAASSTGKKPTGRKHRRRN